MRPKYKVQVKTKNFGRSTPTTIKQGAQGSWTKHHCEFLDLLSIKFY